MKTKSTSSVKAETVKDEIVVDSADVREADELAVKRGHGRVAADEIIVDAVGDRRVRRDEDAAGS
ncbi:MAG: hypothetical protein K2L55_08215 [Muribaculaceae bacterium]|nr:hypothetical protein [Muribaculaceae bacterium]